MQPNAHALVHSVHRAHRTGSTLYDDGHPLDAQSLPCWDCACHCCRCVSKTAPVVAQGHILFHSVFDSTPFTVFNYTLEGQQERGGGPGGPLLLWCTAVLHTLHNHVPIPCCQLHSITMCQMTLGPPFIGGGEIEVRMSAVWTPPPPGYQARLGHTQQMVCLDVCGCARPCSVLCTIYEGRRLPVGQRPQGAGVYLASEDWQSRPPRGAFMKERGCLRGI